MAGETSHEKQLGPEVIDTNVVIQNHPQTKADLGGRGGGRVERG